MTMTKRNRDVNGLITGSIAKVASRRSVVLNRGTNDGVELGDRFQILSQEGESITDPETGEVIQEIPYEKARVEVEEIYERACIAKTYETHFIGGTAHLMSPSLADVFGPRREIYNTFEAEITPDEDTEKDMTVRVGDPVRQLPRVDEA